MLQHKDKKLDSLIVLRIPRNKINNAEYQDIIGSNCFGGKKLLSFYENKQLAFKLASRHDIETLNLIIHNQYLNQNL